MQHRWRLAVVGHKDVALPPYGLDVAGHIGVWFNQLAQSHDGRIDRARRDFARATTHGIHQLRTAERGTGAVNQCVQERKLHRVQRAEAPRTLQATRFGLKLLFAHSDGTGLDRGGCMNGLRHPSEYRTDAGHQFSG